MCKLILISIALSIVTFISSNSNNCLFPCSKRFESFTLFCRLKQQEIIKQIELEDGGNIVFDQDIWDKKDVATNNIIGHGITAVLQGGDFLEKGAVSTTFMRGKLSLERAKAISSRHNSDVNQLIGQTYYASAMSLVLHSRSPLTPTFRADIRYNIHILTYTTELIHQHTCTHACMNHIDILS